MARSRLRRQTPANWVEKDNNLSGSERAQESSLSRKNC
jgi:hypothetical protein